jgi:hypothetical protein
MLAYYDRELVVGGNKDNTNMNGPMNAVNPCRISALKILRAIQLYRIKVVPRY